MAYGTTFRDYPTIEAAEQAALERCRRFGWQGDVLYRVSAVSYAVGDAWGDWRSTGPRLELDAHAVAKWTPCGARLHNGKWVDLRPDRKQWASRTARAALGQFLERRRRQIYILERQLSRAREEHDLTRGLLVHGSENNFSGPIAT